MTALAMDVRELGFEEIDQVSGAEGFWGRVGDAAQNPLRTLGRLVDQIVHESRNSDPSDFGTSGAYVTAKIG